MQDKVRVFKIESFGAVDGPGIRLVIFTQGCEFRCKYCHNPESWPAKNIASKEMSAKDIVSLYEKNKEFYSKGGITISGGEPMLHPEFIKRLGQLCQKHNIHLAIDTSACNFLKNKQAYKDVLDVVNLWIVDIKALTPQEHKFITGSDQLTGIEFAKFLEKNKKDFWIRQVVIKTINANNDYIDKLAAIVKQFKYCKKTELLSYHNLAQDKYAKLGIDYPLKDISMLSTNEFESLKDYLLTVINK